MLIIAAEWFGGEVCIMTPSEIQLVKSSFAAVVPISGQAGELFYKKLFELDPSLRSMFADNLAEQTRKLMQVLATAANGLDRLDTLVPVIEGLVVRHIDYGVKDQHYDTVGKALIWTLGKGLGNAFTEEVKEAWLKAYALLSSTMKTAANRVSAA